MVYDTTTSSFWYIWLKTTNASGDSIAFWKNLATGAAWSLSGNSIDSNLHFLGTTNNAPLKVRVFSKPSGLIDPILFNTFWGYLSGFTNSTGLNANGSGNTGSGYRSLYSNVSGNANAAYGIHTLEANTSGLNNSANGAFAMYSNTTGNHNTGNGAYALYSNNIGNFNTATGLNSLYLNTEGDNNTAFGRASLFYNTSGNYNTAVGTSSLNSNNTGSYNTAIGYYANVSSGNLTNATAIGYGATVNASNKIRLGNSNVTVIEGQVPFTTPSDGRFKFQVKEDVKGLDFILQLRPVTYQFDVKRFDAQYSQAGTGNESSNRNFALQASYDEAASIRRSGFIAQEVEKAAMASGYNFSGIVQPKTAQEHYSLSYESFVVPLVKAVQEQQQIIIAQNKKLADLQQQLDDIKRLLQGTK
jgi:hypothetical protein